MFRNVGYIFRIPPTVFQRGNGVNTSLLKRIDDPLHVRGLSSINQNAHLIEKKDLPRNSNMYTFRTHTCGELKQNNIGEKVILCGWLQYQRLKKFVVLRDGYGIIQVVVKENDLQLQNLIGSLPYETILKVEGVVVPRPEGMVNMEQQTGDIEVLIDKIDVLNKATEHLPFNLREFQKAKESLRMQYRYLDLRFPEMQFNLRTRSRMLMKMREFLINQAGFVDVETPTLFKATPGGAQEYIVPTRFPGQFFSLVQSPQQFKQMLMAGAIDRYFQIARCYRDEGSRPDRQPEFTQLDIEMSFTNTKKVKKLVEDLLRYCWPKFINPLPAIFKEMSYSDAMEKYGSDKPDTRFGFELQDITNIIKPINTYANFYSTCIILKKHFNHSSSIMTKLSTLSEDYPDVKFVQYNVENKEKWVKKVGRIFTDDTAQNLWNFCNLEDSCFVFLAFGPKIETLTLMGKIRVEYVNFLEQNGNKIRSNDMDVLWITDFPLFEKDNATGTIQSVHHPFTSPHPEDLHLLQEFPLNVRSLAYDLVLNGNEIGGGSIRIHDPILQKKVLQLLNIDEMKLHHMLEMLSSGCPPHGGIALGIDRLIATILETPSIRDVIAFPKSVGGRDPISGAPSEITEKEKNIYHIVCK
ncbi:hypothetical protein Trydic_g22550 [Trypoxylus dichotomus]